MLPGEDEEEDENEHDAEDDSDLDGVYAAVGVRIMSTPMLLAQDETVLSVVDIQEKLMAVMEEREKVIASASQLILAARKLGVPVIITEQYRKGLGPSVPEVVKALGDSYQPIEKVSFGCMGEPAYVERLNEIGRKQILLCGVETHVCVLQTCMMLLANGYSVHVAADAVCSRNAEHKAIALAQMRQAGAVVTCVEAAIFQLLGKAGTPEFKEILRILK